MAITRCYKFLLHISLTDRLKNKKINSSLMTPLFLASGQTLYINRKGTTAKKDLIRHEHVCAHINTHIHCANHDIYLCVCACSSICGERDK